MLISGGPGAIYPAMSPRKMRRQPIGTGPFKFVDYKANQYIKVVRNPELLEAGRPAYLDGIEYTILKNVATATMGFTSGAVDMMFPLLDHDPDHEGHQAADAVSGVRGPAGPRQPPPPHQSCHPPFDNRDVRLAMALALDRQAFIDILAGRPRRHRCGAATAAGRIMGHAAPIC